MAASLIGYVRIPSDDQNSDRQKDELLKFNPQEIFEDVGLGKDAERPQLQAALKYCRKGDTLLVYSMDRLARNLDDLRRIVKGLVERGVTVQFIKEDLTFTDENSQMSNLLLSVMGAFVEFERAVTRERQREGINAAKARGVYKGRKIAEEVIVEARKLIQQGMPLARVAKQLGVSRETLYQAGLKSKAGSFGS